MAPIRTHGTHPETSNAAAKHKQNANRQKRRPKKQPNTESTTPGVSKIKSSLRQTRRLLAKYLQDNLAADIRVETERRLKALEVELAQAEVANKERTMATRYHKIKFFERQKVTRKISQIQKQIASAKGDTTNEKLLRTLYDLRVDLNYILHYPKLKKYISLFPPEVRKDERPLSDNADETSQGREEVRSWVRSCMERGELSGEPEQLEASDAKPRPKHQVLESGKTSSKTKSQHMQDALEEDDFFGDDDDEDS